MSVRFAFVFGIIWVSSCILRHLKYRYGHFDALRWALGNTAEGSFDNPTWRGVKKPNIAAGNPPGGCFPSDTHEQLYNGRLPVFRTEEELMTSRPRNFHRMLGFDDDGMVSKGSLGGIVDLPDAMSREFPSFKYFIKCFYKYRFHGLASKLDQLC